KPFPPAPPFPPWPPAPPWPPGLPADGADDPTAAGADIEPSPGEMVRVQPAVVVGTIATRSANAAADSFTIASA
ncbi:MAG: hypothetical protein WCP30_16940, partial [Mycobacteriaceae bacterium]